MKKLVFNLHWLLGLTLGTLLAISGLTGGLMAFAPELVAWANGVNSPAQRLGDKALSGAELYASVSQQLQLRQSDQHIVRLTTFAESDRLAQLELLPLNSEVKRDGPPPKPVLRLVNPYSGAILPPSQFGEWMSGAMDLLRKIHQGHWFAPGNALSKAVWSSVSIAAFSLFFIALSGLYLRWPRGDSAKQFKTWFNINMRLKGRAFLRNVHMVLGTCLLVIYLIVAHTGTFQSTPLSWYGNFVREVLGLPTEEDPPFPPGEVPGQSASPGQLPLSSGQAAPQPEYVEQLFSAMESSVAEQKKVILQFDEGSASLLFDIAGGGGRLTVDKDTGATNVQILPEQSSVKASLAETLLANNQQIHEGRILGIPGVLVMMIAAFSLPVFYVTGWMMYLRRRKKSARSIPVTSASPEAN